MIVSITKTTPKVFISYSWTNPEHEKWVIELAEGLVKDGVHVLLDKWDLREGQDKYHYMETMVREQETDKVLIICDSGYRQKADNKVKGVGDETQILTPEIYSDVKQEKFIPVLAEREIDGKECLPTFLNTRIYIDMSNVEIYDEGYEKLLRNIYNQPEYSRPAIGVPPKWLFSENIESTETGLWVRKIERALGKDPRRLSYLLEQYKEKLQECLDIFEYKGIPDEEPDDEIYSKIELMLPLRDDFVRIIETLCYYDKFDPDEIKNLFEILARYFNPKEGHGAYHTYEFDHYKFFTRELFTYTIMILLKQRKYNLTSILLNSEYFIYDRSTQNYIDAEFNYFDNYLASLDEIWNKRLEQRKLSLTVQILVDRANLKKYPYKKFVECDLLLFYISKLKNHDWAWFPRTCVFS